jgi:hypothetical protein
MAVVAFFARTPGQLATPADGYQLGTGAAGNSIIIPKSFAQCEPFLIFYELFEVVSTVLVLSTIEGDTIVTLSLPLGSGYLEWICNIPAGQQFLVMGEKVFTVQPGSSSACLGNVTTTYSFASYSTGIFQSYTASPPAFTSANGWGYALVCFTVLPSLNSCQIRYHSLPYKLIPNNYRQV